MSKQSHIESTVEEDKATKYDLPSIPMKLVNTTTFSKKQKEKLRKKQEKLDRVLETLGVEEYEFLETFRDKPLELRGLLDRALMKRMTFLSAGGELGGTDEVKAEVLEELEELEDELKGKGKKKKKSKRFQKPAVEEKEPLVINRKTIHDAYYFLKETYVDKLEKKAEEGLDVEKGYLKAKSPSMQRRKSLNNQNNNTLNTGPKVTTRRKSLVGAAAAELKSPNSQRRRKSISLRDE